MSNVDFKIYQNQNIIDNHQQFVHDCHLVHKKFKTTYPDIDSTWGYKLYNIFVMTSPQIIWYNLYKDLCLIIREYANTEDPLWFQCWLNYHHSDEVLDWHGHKFSIHGWINIDPKHTKTIFEGYEIYNSVGNIYIGPGHRKHKVVVEENYIQPRITLGFDVMNKAHGWSDNNFIPIL